MDANGSHDGAGMAKQMEEIGGDTFAMSGDQAQLIPGKQISSSGPSGPGDVGSGSSFEDGSEVAPLQMEMDKSKMRCQAEGLHVIIVSAISFSVAVTVALIITIYFGPPQVPPRGSVSSDSSTCSDIGIEMLKKGGSAVDAAVATVFCLGVVHPHATGIGGGGLMMIRDNKQKQSDYIDFLPTAPGGATMNMFEGKATFAFKGGLSVAVPGQVRGLYDAHQKFGKLAWKDLIMPSVVLAREGFLVSPALAEAMNDELKQDNQLALLKKIFFNTTTNKMASVNETVQMPELAITLEIIANDGVEAFYSGMVASEIVNAVAGDGGILDLEDLKNYQAVSGKPLQTVFHNVTVQSTPPPSAGVMVLEALAILNNFGWKNSSAAQGASYQRLIEALKFAYAERGKLGDPAYSEQVQELTQQMLNTSLTTILAGKIDENKTQIDKSFYGQLIGLNSQHGTSQVSVLGTNEDMVSLTTSLNTSFISTHVSVFGPSEDMVSLSLSLSRPFGSHVMTNGGVLLNSFMDDFSEPEQNDEGMPPNQFNMIQPGKRPVVPMAPTVTFSAERPCARRVALGGEGGTSIVSGIVSVLLRLIGFREDLQSAITAKRFHDQLRPEGLQYEEGVEQKLLDYLSARGHDLIMWYTPNVINAVAKINETVQGWADTRGGGKSATFGETKALQ